jgi:hypothetical protein
MATFVVALSALFAVVGKVPGVGAHSSSSSVGPVQVSAAIHHDVSPPLRDMVAQHPIYTGSPDRPLRLTGPVRSATPQAPGALQTTSGPHVATSNGLSFDGVGQERANPCSCAPGDPNGAVGATQFVQIVNTAFAVYNKTSGAIATGFPKANNTLWTGFGGGCEANDDGDPIAQYDKAAGRWLIAQFSVSTTPYLECVAVSTTSDATGSYNRYAFSYGNTQFPDYPKIGVWPDAYYTTYNIFNNATTFAGAKVCAFDRTSMLSGAAATQQCFQLSKSFGSLLPSDLDGTTAPPAGSPNFLLNFGTNSLNLWKFHVDFAHPGNTTLTGPINLPVAAFSEPCNGGGSCIPQPNTNNKLDSLGDRLMYRLAYRNRGGTESLVVNHTVFVSGNNHSQVDGVRWYELRVSRSPDPTGTLSVFQQGTFSPDATSRWMGSIAMDKNGDIALGFSASNSSSVFPSLRYTGRLSGDALGTMEAENAVFAGLGSQTGTLHRWGDYSALSVDPADDCTFWYTNEYLKSNGSFNWSTRIVSFKFTSCV